MNCRTTILVLFSGVSTAVTLGEEAAFPHIPAESFVVPDGFEVSVWATSPLFYNPTNMDVDIEGRMWVAEGRNYRLFRNKKGFKEVEEGDRIMVLTDTDQDGKADKSHVFVQDKELIAPLGVAVIDNQVVVSQPPKLLVYTDVNRDAVFDPEVDKKETLLEGFGGNDHDHSLHAVTAGPSGQWYFNTGNAGTHVVADKEGWTLRAGSIYKGGSPSVTNKGPLRGGQYGLKSDDGHVYVGAVALRMNPDGTGLRPIGHNMRNSYEETVTSFGDVFQSDNDDPAACRVTWLMEYGNLGFCSDDGARKWQVERRPGQTTAIAEWRQEDPGTIPAGDVYGTGSPTGVAYYENGSFGKKHEGLLMACEAARNVVFGYYPKPEGAGFKLERFDFFRSKRANEFQENGEEKAAFANKFRPADVTVGADGSIYVADWFDPGVGGHRMGDPQMSGAIYRITPKGENPQTPEIDLTTIEGQIAALKSPANNVRNAGFTRLKARRKGAVSVAQALLKEDNAYFRARGIWLLAQLGDEGVKVVKDLLETSEDAQTRITCFRALRFIDEDIVALAQRLVKDPSSAVRREIALVLRDRSWGETGHLLVELLKGYDGSDRWYLEALGTGATGKEKQFYEAALGELKGDDPLKWTRPMVEMAWRLHPVESVFAFRQRALSRQISVSDRKKALTALGFISAKEAAMAMVEIAEKGPADTKSLAQWWLHNRGGHVWKKYVPEMKGLNKKVNQLPADRNFTVALNTPEAVKLSVEEVLKLKGDPQKGKIMVARCYLCHQMDGQGVDFGPALDGWGQGRSLEEIATAIVEPNAGIAHGFEASELVTKEGHTVQGFLMSAGNPYVLKVMGGGEVAAKRLIVESIKVMDKSLMLSAGQLGLQAQEVADIVAYLKEGNSGEKSSDSSDTTP